MRKSWRGEEEVEWGEEIFLHAGTETHPDDVCSRGGSDFMAWRHTHTRTRQNERRQVLWHVTYTHSNVSIRPPPDT